MSQYRSLVPGGTFFFTGRLELRGSRLLVDQVDLLRMAVRVTQQRLPFHIDTAVILPDHLHMIWDLPPGDAGFPERWRMIKSVFARHLARPDDLRPSSMRRGEKGIWQRRNWEHQIRDGDDLAAHRIWALAAPVRAGFCARAEDWRWSSARRGHAGEMTLPVTAGFGPEPVT